MKERIVSFDALRSFFILSIILYHTDIVGKRFLSQGYLAVEMFFVLSGFLLANSYFKHRIILESYNLFKEMIWHKIKRLYPEYLFTTVLVFIIYTVFFHIRGLSRYIFWNLIMYGHLGLAPNIVDGSWYVGALFWGTFVTLALMIKYREGFFISAPLLFLSSCILLFHANNTSLMSTARLVLNIFPFGFLRAIAGLSMGVIAYYVYQNKWLQNKILNVFILIITLISTYLLLDNNRPSETVYNIYFLALFLILSSATLDRHMQMLFDNKFFQYLAKISYMVFLTNILVLKIIAKYIAYFPLINKNICIIFAVFSCFAFAALCYHMQKWLFIKLKQILFIPQSSHVE